MRPWTEGEVFAFLADHLARSAADCEALAVKRDRGQIYNRLRHDLEKIEDMCRIVHYMRQDARWLEYGARCAACHKQAGDWLRGVPQKPDAQGRQRPHLRIPEGERHPLFLKLADYLRNMEKQIQAMRTAKTGRVGMILPRMLAPPGVRQPTNYRPQPLRQTKGGVLLPNSVTA